MNLFNIYGRHDNELIEERFGYLRLHQTIVGSFRGVEHGTPGAQEDHCTRDQYLNLPRPI